MPKQVRWFAQMCAGALIGSSITRENLLSLKYMILPVVIVLLGMVIMNYTIGFLLYKTSGIDLKTALFSAVPAGVADMALIADEFHADGPRVALL